MADDRAAVINLGDDDGADPLLAFAHEANIAKASPALPALPPAPVLPAADVFVPAVVVAKASGRVSGRRQIHRSGNPMAFASGLVSGVVMALVFATTDWSVPSDAKASAPSSVVGESSPSSRSSLAMTLAPLPIATSDIARPPVASSPAAAPTPRSAARRASSTRRDTRRSATRDVLSSNTPVSTIGYAPQGTLAVYSQPRGANVFLNGRRVGKTPLLLDEMPAGSRAVRLQLDGYSAWSQGVRIVANESTTVAAKLTPTRTRN